MNSTLARRFVTRLRAHSAKLRTAVDRGATAVEYALLVALVAIAIIGAATTLGGSIVDKLTGASTALDCSQPNNGGNGGEAPPAECADNGDD